MAHPPNDTVAGDTPTVSPEHPLTEFARAFVQNQQAVFGLIILGAIVLATVFGPALYGISPDEMVDMPFIAPGLDTMPAGTDYLGRDLLAGILIGGRATLIVGAFAAVICMALGILIGSAAGFFGGVVDAALIKITEFFQILPPLLLAMVLVLVFGPKLATISFAIGIVSWPQVARLARAEFLRIRNLDYVQAARTAGAGNAYLLFVVILPGALPPLIVAAGLAVSSAILFEAGLAFLGLGDPNVISWGQIIGQNRNYMLEAWWTVALPGLAIFLTVLGISLVGDGINDALNPRLRRR